VQCSDRKEVGCQRGGRERRIGRGEAGESGAEGKFRRPEGGHAVIAQKHGITPLAPLDLAEVKKVADVLATSDEAVVGRGTPPQIHVGRRGVGLVGLEVNLEEQLRRGRLLRELCFTTRKHHNSGHSQKCSRAERAQQGAGARKHFSRLDQESPV
jgi:hypothetical protein